MAKSNASPLGGGVRQFDTSNPSILEQIQRLTELQGANTPQELVIDPRADIHAAVPPPYEPYAGEDEETREDLRRDIPDPDAVRRGEVGFIPQSMDDIAAISAREGVPIQVPGTQTMEIQGEQGEAVFDPVTGEQVSVPIEMGDYQAQIERETTQQGARTKFLRQIGRAGSDLDIMKGVVTEQLVESWETEARDHPQASQFLRGKMDTAQARADSAARFAGSIAPTLQNMMRRSITSLFSDHAPRFVRYQDEHGRVLAHVAPGYAVMNDEGMDPADEEQKGAIAISAALGASSAISNMGLQKIKGGAVAPDEGTPYGADTAYRGNVIEAFRYHISNALEQAGARMSQKGVRALAIAKVEAMERDGELVRVNSIVDGDSRIVLAPSPMMSREARNISRLARAVTGELGRGRASSVPLLGGRGIVDGGTGVTYQSLTKIPGGKKGIVRNSVESAKTLLSSMGFKYSKANVERMRFELEELNDPEWVQLDDESGKKMYSGHRFAKKFKVHKGAYEAAMNEVRPPEGYIEGDPEWKAVFEAAKKKQALDVMETKFKSLDTYFKMVEQSQGRPLFNKFIHAFNNHRIYPNASDLDYTSSKEVLRDTMGFIKAEQVQPNSLFDAQKILRVQKLNHEIWKHRSDNLNFGADVHAKLTALSPMDLAAMGAMRTAVIYHSTALEPLRLADGRELNTTRMHPGDVISSYTPQMGNVLADLGKKYQAYRKLKGEYNAAKKAAAESGQPAPPPFDESPFSDMLDLWANIDPGAAQAVLNLWDDFANMRAASRQGPTGDYGMELTHQAMADGNQSGIMWQAAFYGVSNDPNSRRNDLDIIAMTTQANPLMQSLRAFGWGTVQRELIDSLEDHPELQKGWQNFFDEVHGAEARNLDAVASSGFKKPLMQASYSKNPMSFLNEAQDFLEDPDFSEAFDKHLREIYGDPDKAAADLRDAIGASLHQIIDSKSNRMLMQLSQMMAVLNQPFHYHGPTGDSIIISPVGLATINMGGHGKNTLNIPVTLPDGRKIRIKVPNLKVDTFYNSKDKEDDSTTDYEVQERQYLPAEKRTRSYYNKTTREIVTIEEPYGYALRRMAPVLMIQALDGDAIAAMINWVNSERNLRGLPPLPVITVHDASISSAGNSIIYENAYNNIVIPELIRHVKHIGKELYQNLQDANAATVKYLAEQDKIGGIVGIGADGEFPALGGIFNEYHKKLISDSYSKVWKDKNKFESKKKEWTALLKEAEANGWVPEDILEMSPDIVPGTLAVTPQQARNLFALAKKFLGLDPKSADAETIDWLEAHEKNVDRGLTRMLQMNTRGGQAQLSPSQFKSGANAPQNVPATSTKATQAEERANKKTAAQEDEQTALDFIKEKGLNDLPKTPPPPKLSPEAEARGVAIVKKEWHEKVKRHIYTDVVNALTNSGTLFKPGKGDNSRILNVIKGIIRDTPVDDLKASYVVQEVKKQLSTIQKTPPSFMRQTPDENDEFSF